GVRAEALAGLCLSPRLFPAGGRKRRAASGRFETEHGAPATLRGAALTSLAGVLAESPGALTPYSEVLAKAQAYAGRPFIAPEEVQLREDLLTLYGQRRLGLSALAFSPPAELPARIRLTPFNAALARDRGLLVGALHQARRITAATRALCGLLETARTLDELKASEVGKDFGDALAGQLRALSRMGCFMSEG
ncbi:MAG: hypothetical protein ACYC8V_12995, partial [Caulobacteraceae bacterium]